MQFIEQNNDSKFHQQRMNSIQQQEVLAKMAMSKDTAGLQKIIDDPNTPQENKALAQRFLGMIGGGQKPSPTQANIPQKNVPQKNTLPAQQSAKPTAQPRNFDPMTGKPINTTWKFDPMTGKPLR